MLEFKLPEVGENITSGQVVKINVSQGDTVTQDQTLIELETEKATIEIPSPCAGTISGVLVHQGDTIKIGQGIVKIDEGGEQQEKSEGQQPEQEKQKEEEKKNESTPEPASEPEPDSRPEPKDQDKQPSEPQQTSQPDPVPQINVSFADVNASPSIRRLARELGVDLHQVQGSGPQGAISEDDVKNFVKQILTSPSGSVQGSGAERPLPDFSKWGEIERKPLSSIRKKTAEHLSHAWQAIPHVTQFGKADITELEQLRKKYSTPDHKLTITPFLMKVVAAALKQFPNVNASIDMQKHELISKKYVHIGVAVDTENGLLVPVIRDVNQKSILELSLELKEAAERARVKKLSLEDMTGGCFTITNLGSLGADLFTPIVNWPEAAILGVSRAQLQPMFQEATCSPRLILPLTLSYDHRIIDGADGARFMRWICEAIENPFMLELN